MFKPKYIYYMCHWYYGFTEIRYDEIVDYKPNHNIKYTSLLYNCTASLDSYIIVDQEDLARVYYEY
jgi:hypothetical protein